MKKAKYIIKKMNAGLVESCKKISDINVLSRIVMWVAIAMVVVALGVICFYKPARMAVFSTETHTVVEVKSGDTLSKLLGDQGFAMRDIDVISKNLKKDAEFTTLRAGRDKIDFVRPNENAPISKIIIENGPWNKIEIDCGTPDTWQCQKIEIARDTRIAFKEGEIAQGSSFYLSAMDAGIPEGALTVPDETIDAMLKKGKKSFCKIEC